MGSSNSVLKKEKISKYWNVSKKVLGKGSFATVREGRKKASKNAERQKIQADFPDVIAVKIVEKSKAKDEEELELFQDEVEIMHRVDHPSCQHLVSRDQRVWKLPQLCSPLLFSPFPVLFT